MKKNLKSLTIMIIMNACLITVSSIKASDSDQQTLDIENSRLVRKISFEEMVDEIAFLNEVTETEVIDKFVDMKTAELSLQKVQFQTVTRENVLELLASGSYITVKTEPFPLMNSLYRAKGLVFYGEGDKPAFDKARMSNILNVSFDRSNYLVGTGYPKSKQFSGEVYVNLEANDRIRYSVNGDFYNNGTTTISGGISIGIGQSGQLNFSVSYTNNHFGYLNHVGYWTGTW